ncbi:unnamed protein product, partial [Phaeothamnion confervicola]
VDPKHHQKLLRRHMMKPSVHGLIVFHGLGTGKTLSSIFTANAWLHENKKGRVLVVVNASMRDQFRNEIRTASKHWRRYKVVSREQYLNKPSSCGGKFLIIDEAHNLRSVDSRITTAMLKCSAKAAKVMLLTATPIVNGVYEMAILMNMANPKLRMPMTKDRFVNEYGRNGLKNQKKMKDAMKGLLSYHVSSGTGFPSKEIHELFIPMTQLQCDAYNAVVKGGVSGGASGIDAWGSEEEMEKALKFFQKPRQMCNMAVINGVKHKPKIDALVSNVVDSVRLGRKCLVYSQYLEAGVDEIESMLKMAKIPYGKIVGDSTNVKKAEA